MDLKLETLKNATDRAGIEHTVRRGYGFIWFTPVGQPSIEEHRREDPYYDDFVEMLTGTTKVFRNR